MQKNLRRTQGEVCSIDKGLLMGAPPRELKTRPRSDLMTLLWKVPLHPSGGEDMRSVHVFELDADPEDRCLELT